mmetsp:Transcript_30372/g.55202  ORF Transcript_30372/g.55202 Transcript_30372/m.55202 type:complete len:232 (-) Transcript_30372:906-1601(-)
MGGPFPPVSAPSWYAKLYFLKSGTRLVSFRSLLASSAARGWTFSTCRAENSEVKHSLPPGFFMDRPKSRPSSSASSRASPPVVTSMGGFASRKATKCRTFPEPDTPMLWCSTRIELVPSRRELPVTSVGIRKKTMLEGLPNAPSSAPGSASATMAASKYSPVCPSAPERAFWASDEGPISCGVRAVGKLESTERYLPLGTWRMRKGMWRHCTFSQVVLSMGSNDHTAFAER